MLRNLVGALTGLAFLTLGILLVAGATIAGATPITYASFSGTVIDFDGLTGDPVIGSGEVLGAQFTGSGVTFTVPNFAAYATRAHSQNIESFWGFPFGPNRVMILL